MSSRERRPSLALAHLLLATFLTGVAGGFVWALAPQKTSWLGPLSGGTLVLALASARFLLRIP